MKNESESRGRTSFRLEVIASIITAVIIVTIAIFQASQNRSVKFPAGGQTAGNGIEQTLTGEAAIRHLKQEGQYESLALAMAAARYQVEWETNPMLPGIGGAHHARNPAQGFSAYFTREGLRLAEFGRPKQGCQGCDAGLNWQMALKLKGYGYGNKLIEIPGREIKAARNRVEYVHSDIIEWYENKAEGLEQGFTINAPPAADPGAEGLRVVMRLSGDLEGELVADGQAVTLLDRHRHTLLRYSELKAWDALGRPLEARMSLRGTELALEVADAGATYPLTIDPLIAQQAKLAASDGAADDYFGGSVAISGETVVVGAPGGGNMDQGSAYVFVRGGTSWTEQAKLTASDGAADDGFGNSVAISGETVVVGAYDDDIGGNVDQGSAYVFVRSGTSWTEQAKLIASDGAVNDYFGIFMAINGETVVVGAPGDDIGGNVDQGSAYVFVRGGTSWTQQQKLTASDGAVRDEFGVSVAISGETVVVGANADDIGGKVDQGSAYVFVRSGTNWMEQAKLIASDGAAYDFFGFPVAISGETVVVGTNADDISGNFNQGSAYVFVRSGTSWTQQQKLTASDGAVNDQFGVFVAIGGETVVVGAWFDDIGGNADQGSAYVFVRSGTSWTEQAKLTASDGAAGDRFGLRVAIGGETVLVGAPMDGIGGNANQGSAYVFTYSVCPAISVAPTSLANGVVGASYNQTIGASGGIEPYTYVVSGNSLPQGLTLNAGTGVLSGTPTQPGTFNFTVRATDANGCMGERAYALIIGCVYTLNPTVQNFGVSGGSGSVSVTAEAGCGWTALSNDDWITITSGPGGTGSGVVQYSVAANPTVLTRTGTMTIAGLTFTVNQAEIRYEGDVAPRPNGSGTLVVSDWVQVGRFSVGLDTPTAGSEFQRADCAPRNTFGDGKITVADWVQAGRYSVGLDPVTEAGGPESQTMMAANPRLTMAAQAEGRLVRAVNTTFRRGEIGTMPVELEALGNENAISFTLSYDPRQAIFLDAVGAENEVVVAINAKQASRGKVAIAVALPSGKVFTAGTHGLLTLRFIPVGGEGRTSMEVWFDDSLAERELVDPGAVRLGRPEFIPAEVVIEGSSAAIVSAASYEPVKIAVESIATVFGRDLAAWTESAMTDALPVELAGSRVTVTDSEGAVREAQLFYVSSGQINFLVPEDSALGPATVRIVSGSGAVSTGLIEIVEVAPGIFTSVRSCNRDYRGRSRISRLNRQEVENGLSCSS